MPLHLDLGPFEQIFIGKSVLTNGGERTLFTLEGETPILRARDVLADVRAVNSVEKLYRCIQQMYLEEDTQKYQGSYLALAAQTISEFPACYAEIEAADELIKGGNLYKALKILKKLISYKAFSLSKAESDGHLLQAAARGR
jgi:flagellar biosynthesis repressor protein FlbT